MTNEETSRQEGRWFPLEYYFDVIKSDTDVYYKDDDGKKQLLCSFRKKVIPDELSNIGFESLYRYAARWHTNRGAAAGLVDSARMPPHVARLTQRDKFRAYYYTKDGKLTKKEKSIAYATAWKLYNKRKGKKS